MILVRAGEQVEHCWGRGLVEGHHSVGIVVLVMEVVPTSATELRETHSRHGMLVCRVLWCERNMAQIVDIEALVNTSARH